MIPALERQKLKCPMLETSLEYVVRPLPQKNEKKTRKTRIVEEDDQEKQKEYEGKKNIEIK